MIAEFMPSLGTQVPVARSVSQIQLLVQKFDAREFRTSFVDGIPSAVRFTIVDPHLAGAGKPAEFTVELSAHHEAIYQVLWDRRRYVPTAAQDAALKDQARRIAWRQLHDVIRAQLIAVNCGMLTVGEAFMPNLVVVLPGGRETRLGPAMQAEGLLTPTGGRLQLGSGS